jgi:hypothetical protein
MAKIYTEMPPKSAKAARQAWEYFRIKYPAVAIQRLTYTAGGMFAGENGWTIERDMKDAILNAAIVYDFNGVTQRFASSREVREYFR